MLAKDITEKSDSFSVADIVNVSIGVDTKDGFAVILPKNRSVDAPVVYSRLVTAEKTSSLTIVTRQGEDTERGRNKFVGQLELPFGEEVPKETPISVKMGLDDSGNIVASAWKGSKADERLASEPVTMGVEHRKEIGNGEGLEMQAESSAGKDTGDADPNPKPEQTETENVRETIKTQDTVDQSRLDEVINILEDLIADSKNDNLVDEGTNIVAQLENIEEMNGIINKRDIAPIRKIIEKLLAERGALSSDQTEAIQKLIDELTKI